MRKVYTNIEKEFKSRYGSFTICRLDYEDLMIPMAAVLVSDEQMQKIVDAINLSMANDYDAEHLRWLERYRGLGAENGLTQEQINYVDRMFIRVFAYFESFALEFGMKYYGDFSEPEREEISAAVKAESESGF